MTALAPQTLIFADLRSKGATPVEVAVNDAMRAAVAETLELLDLRKLRFVGTIQPAGAKDWALEAELGATVTQACVVTLGPVTTRIDEKITRRYVAEFDLPDAGEVEMPEDDTTEPLPRTLDLVEVMIEALSLALPQFPRADGAELGDINITEPGKTAMTDEDAKPFAGLAGLRDALASKEDPDT